MEIINIEKLIGHNVIVMTGRNIDILLAAQQIVIDPSYPQEDILSYPGSNDYFLDYPTVISDRLKDEIDGFGGAVIIKTQSAEFLDCLLTSDIEFVLATVRRFDKDGLRNLRLRVLSKEEAWENRRDFHMELRV